MHAYPRDRRGGPLQQQRRRGRRHDGRARNENAIKKACNTLISELPIEVFKVKTLEENLCKNEKGDTIVYRTVESIKTEVIPMVTDNSPIK